MSDPIRREDAIEVAYQLRHKPNDAEWAEWLKAFNAIPSVPQKAIAEVTFDEEKLREIVKEAVERFKEEYEIVDRPQGEWKPKNHHTDYCSNCGFEETQWRTADYNYCPLCGAQMKGADDA